MARCANCGRDIPLDDKTKLCDDCKRVILPFVKFMEASTTPAVKRLYSNERNLRNAGVTDGGMDYLYRICSLHDRKRAAEQEAKRNREYYPPEPAPEVRPPAPEPSPEAPPEASTTEEEEHAPEKTPGVLLPAAMWILILSGVADLVWFVARILTHGAAAESVKDSIDVSALAGMLSSFSGAYIAAVVRKHLRMKK